jgi:hypothetical protein
MPAGLGVWASRVVQTQQNRRQRNLLIWFWVMVVGKNGELVGGIEPEQRFLLHDF